MFCAFFFHFTISWICCLHYVCSRSVSLAVILFTSWLRPPHLYIFKFFVEEASSPTLFKALSRGHHCQCDISHERSNVGVTKYGDTALWSRLLYNCGGRSCSHSRKPTRRTVAFWSSKKAKKAPGIEGPGKAGHDHQYLSNSYVRRPLFEILLKSKINFRCVESSPLPSPSVLSISTRRFAAYFGEILPLDHSHQTAPMQTGAPPFVARKAGVLNSNISW